MSRGALLVATASVATGLLAGPSAAYAADTSTPLSAAEMSSALKAVSAASATAAAKGWTGAANLTAGSLTGSESFVVDPVAGMAFEQYAFSGQSVTQYVVAGKGTYVGLADPTSRAALKMMHRASVRYVFTADRSVRLDDPTEVGISPAALLTEDAAHAGTRTAHDDGSVDYQFSEDGETLTVHVTAAGVLASVEASGDGAHATLTYAYGPQHVTVPSASATVGSAELARGVAYLTMASSVKQLAGRAATDALAAAHHRPISVSALRSVTQRDVQAANADIRTRMIRSRSVRGGTRVYATNPWTHRTVSYTLTVSGRRITIASGGRTVVVHGRPGR